MQRWQYKMEVFHANPSELVSEVVFDLEIKLDELGMEGWELVSITNEEPPRFCAFFKRPRGVEPDPVARELERQYEEEYDKKDPEF